jgi:hypothetical protein
MWESAAEAYFKLLSQYFYERNKEKQYKPVGIAGLWDEN